MKQHKDTMDWYAVTWKQHWTVTLQIEDKEQFIEECVNEYPDKFSPDDYVDAFDWIAINVCCKKCSKEVEWISLELS